MYKKLPKLSSETKFGIHLIVLHLLIVFYIHRFAYTEVKSPTTGEDLDPFEEYGVTWTYLLYFFRILIFLVLPQCTFNYLGLCIYNSFVNTVELNGSASNAPPICFRVVTRGDYPALIKKNLIRNLKTCSDVGLMDNFSFEIVTDKEIPDLETGEKKVRMIVVPNDYVTKTGALFKARALQYCLEEGVNQCAESDYIVHLDEETLLTVDSVRGIINFVLKGKHEFGQGVITYANEEIRNWVTTLADSFRVTEDYGKLRFQFRMFHRPVFGWKGSFVVTRFKAEKDVSFDHGVDGSVAEDCYFSMIAYKKGYTFDFIEGEMWEKSPFNLKDFLQQRKRWLQGISLVVHSSKIPLKNKLFLAMSLYGWLTLPLTTSNIIWTLFYPLPSNNFVLLHYVLGFTAGINTYMYMFGVVKSFTLRRVGLIKFALCLVCSTLAIPFNVIIENIAVIWGIFSNKYRFYVVQKI